jgi:hypothetical protein
MNVPQLTVFTDSSMNVKEDTRLNFGRPSLNALIVYQ